MRTALLLTVLCVLAACATTDVTAVRSQSLPLPAAFDGNTLLCRNESNRALCHLWLYADGRYFLFYDRGVQQQLPVAGGNFRIEGRRGRYTLAAGSGNTLQLCMQPEATPGKTFQIEIAAELYAGAGCYELAVSRQPGESWMQTASGGATYKLWLVRGRG